MSMVDSLSDLTELRALYSSLQQQRQDEQSRQRAAIQQSEVARRELADHYEALALAEARIAELEAKPVYALPVIRAGADQKTPINAGFLGRLVVSLLRRFARKAARRGDYATAEILYQCMCLFEPKAFLFKQIGNMLYQQKLYLDALRALEVAQQKNSADPETIFFLNAINQALDKE